MGRRENLLSANILNGITRLVTAYGDALNDDIFKEKVGDLSIKELVRTARDRKAGSLGFAEAMLQTYNKKRRLP